MDLLLKLDSLDRISLSRCCLKQCSHLNLFNWLFFFLNTTGRGEGGKKKKGLQIPTQC